MQTLKNIESYLMKMLRLSQESLLMWIDGIRLDICRPHKNQQCCYNGWLKQHNLLLVYIASPDGFYLGTWDVHPGSIPDISYQSYYDINAQLEDIGLKIGADKGFSKESMIKPFQKDN